MKRFQIILTLGLSLCLVSTGHARQNFSTLDVKKQGESEIRNAILPLIEKYCREQCKINQIQTEVDLAVDDLAAPGFEESAGKVTLAPASGKVVLLIDENLGQKTRVEFIDLVKTELNVLDYPVQIEVRNQKFPQPASSTFKVAELRERVTRDIRTGVQNLLTQFCPDHCTLGEFTVQTENLNPEDIDYSSSQEYFQDGSAAIRVKGVLANVMVDQDLPKEEASGIVEMVRLKVAQFKGSQVQSISMKFPKPITKEYLAKLKGMVGDDSGRSPASDTSSASTSTQEQKVNHQSSTLEQTTKDSKTAMSESKESKLNSVEENKKLLSESSQTNANRQEKFERFEKIERVENGDAVQAKLEEFKNYAVIFAAIVLALLLTLVGISFRKNIWEAAKGVVDGSKNDGPKGMNGASSDSNNLTNDEKAALIGKRIEADRLHSDLTQIFTEQPKVAKHVFTLVLTEEGVETTAQYLELFGESVVMDLLRDPGLQGDLAELMDFYARNTFELNDEEKLMLLKKLHHRTVAAKMAVHGSRSAALFDFLAEMDTPQIVEMIKNESNTVKAIILTQSDQKKRQAIFAQQDEQTQLRLMTELSRIDHLPKTYIQNVASALRRKKAENPKLNTEALPGTDVLVTFLEKANLDTQRTIIQQLMTSAGADVIQNLKNKMISLETLRYLKDQQVPEVITFLKHDELVHFLQGAPINVKDAVLSKCPQDLSSELVEELQMAEPVSREAFTAVERKMINRLKVLANQGQINLAEVNEKMFSEEFSFRGGESSDFDLRRVG